jgi:hypothetical protein
MLLWIDSPDSDLKTVEDIRKTHPTLQVKFIPALKDAELYVQQNLHDIKSQDKFITICRGYYVAESRSFADVAEMFDKLNLGTKPLGVYTRNREFLLKQTPNPPKRAEIFDQKHKLLAFVNSHLKK